MSKSWSRLLKTLLALILLAGTWGVMPPQALHAAERGTLSMVGTVIERGQPLTIHYTGAQGSKDWIGIYRAGETPRKGTNAWRWEYVADMPAGTVTLTDGSDGRKEYPKLADLPTGEYYIAFLLNDGYTEHADRFAFTIVDEVATEPDPVSELSVMSFNLWAGDAINKVGKDKVIEFLTSVIETSGADVIGIQESRDEIVTQAAVELGYHVNIKAGKSTSLLSKYPILDVDADRDYYLIEVEPGKAVAIGNVHLSSSPYGPYSIMDGKTVEAVMADENQKHMVEMRNTFSKLPKLAEQGMPVFLTGDFNVPSHLDWTEANKDRYFNTVMEWPVSKRLEQLGMIDSYRVMHPDPVAAPGITWAVEGTEWRKPKEVYDRIDYVYAGGPATTLESRLVGEKEVEVDGGPISYADIQMDAYLSDHRAVVSTFSVTPRSIADLQLPTVEFDGTLSMDRTVVDRGEPLTIRYTGAQGGKDWIGIYRVGETPQKGTNAWKWGYVADMPNGTITLTDESEGRKEYPRLADLAPGDYYIAFLLNDGYTEHAARFPFQIVDKPGTPQELEAIRLMKERIVDYYISRDIINDGTNGRVEWTYKSEAGTYLSNQNANGSWSDVDYASTQSSANGRAWSPYLALDRMQSMAQAFADPESPHYHSEAMLEGIQKALDHWFTVKPTSTNWWETGIGKQLRLGKIALLCEGYLTAEQADNIIGTMDSKPHTVDGANSSWYNQNYMYRGLLLEDPVIVRNGVEAFNVLSNVTTTVTGIQSDMSFFMHGKTNYTTGYGRSFARDMSFWAYITSGTMFAYSPAAIDSLSSYMLDGTRYLVRGEVADLGMGMNGPDWPSYDSWALTFYEDPIQWLQTANPKRAAEFASFLNNIRNAGTSASNGLVANNMTQWQTLVSSHMRNDYGITVKMASSSVKGGEWRTINPDGYNLLHWTPQGATAIQRTGDEYRTIYPLMDWTHVPGTTAPNYLTKDGNYNNPRTFVGGVTDERYGATAFDFHKLGTSGKKGYFFFDDEMVALGAAIASTYTNPIHTTLNQALAVGDVIVDGNVVTEGTLPVSGRWAYNDRIGYIFPTQTDFQVKLETKTGSWSDVVTGSSTAPITKPIFSMWLDHGVKPAGASYQYIVLPNKTSEQVGQYANDNPIRILSNTSEVQAVRHQELGMAQMLFYQPGTVTVRDGLTVTVDKPAMVIVDESASPVRISVANPETPGITVNVTLDRNGETSTTSFKLGKDTFTGRSVSLNEAASIDDRGFDLAYNKGATASSSIGNQHASNATDIYRTSHWASNDSDGEWIYVDLQKSYSVYKVRLNWGEAYGKAYKIQVSSDAVSWTDVYTTSIGDGGIDDMAFKPVEARYVRMQGVKQGNGSGYSLREFNVYEAVAPNLAEGMPVAASSSRAADVAPKNAVDGSLSTRWGSNYSDAQWIYVDLGARQAIEKVVLHWEAAYGKEYRIEVSDDAADWKSVYSTTTGSGGVEEISIEPTDARYVRMLGIKRGSNYGYSLWEFKVFGALATVPGAPADVQAVGYDGFAEVSFAAPADNGGSGITGYTVTAWTDGEPFASAEGAESPIIVPGLTNGVAYTFTVVATNAQGASAASEPSNAVVPSPEGPMLPAAPTGLTSVAGDRQVRLKWDAAADAESYAVYQYEGASAPLDPEQWVVAARDVTDPAFTVTGLVNDVTYVFAVKAVNASGESDFSAASIATPKVPLPPTTGPIDNNGGNASVIKSTTGSILIPTGRGGEVSLDNEVILTISAGAAEQELRIEIVKLSGTANLVFDKETLVSNVFEMTKNMTDNFKKPIVISMKFDPSLTGDNQRVAIFYYDEDNKGWIEVGGVVTGDRITAEVDHFTKFAVMAVGKKEDGSGVPNKPAPSFTDIAGHWAKGAILSAAGHFVNGYPDGTFRPDAAITRAEFTIMLANVLKLEGSSSAPAFADSEQIGGWAKQDIANAVEAGIVGGYTDGSFRPNARITRAEMATMVARALKLPADSGATTGFADHKDIPNWAKGAIEAVQEQGIMNGRGGNKFVPNDTATRAEAVTLLMRILELGAEQ